VLMKEGPAIFHFGRFAELIPPLQIIDLHPTLLV